MIAIALPASEKIGEPESPAAITSGFPELYGQPVATPPYLDLDQLAVERQDFAPAFAWQIMVDPCAWSKWGLNTFPSLRRGVGDRQCVHVLD